MLKGFTSGHPTGVNTKPAERAQPCMQLHAGASTAATEVKYMQCKHGRRRCFWHGP